MQYAILCYNDESVIETWSAEEDADTMLRLMPIRPELKLGVVTALIGAPFLFSLIQRLRREA